MRWWPWRRHRRGPSPEACAARRAAEEARSRAEADLRTAKARRQEIADHYDKLLRRVITER